MLPTNDVPVAAFQAHVTPDLKALTRVLHERIREFVKSRDASLNASTARSPSDHSTTNLPLMDQQYPYGRAYRLKRENRTAQNLARLRNDNLDGHDRYPILRPGCSTSEPDPIRGKGLGEGSLDPIAKGPTHIVKKPLGTTMSLSHFAALLLTGRSHRPI